MNVDLEEVKEIALKQLANNPKSKEFPFDAFWESMTVKHKESINHWLAEAVLNNYLRYIELNIIAAQR